MAAGGLPAHLPYPHAHPRPHSGQDLPVTYIGHGVRIGRAAHVSAPRA
jgi:hypothetical protein